MVACAKKFFRQVKCPACDTIFVNCEHPRQEKKKRNWTAHELVLPNECVKKKMYLLCSCTLCQSFLGITAEVIYSASHSLNKVRRFELKTGYTCCS